MGLSFSSRCNTYVLRILIVCQTCVPASQWRHNVRDGVSNHGRLDCLLNRLCRRKSKKTSKFRVTGLCKGNSPVTGNFPHKGQVTRKMFSFDDVIMRGKYIGQRWIMTTHNILCVLLVYPCPIYLVLAHTFTIMSSGTNCEMFEKLKRFYCNIETAL